MICRRCGTPLDAPDAPCPGCAASGAGASETRAGLESGAAAALPATFGRYRLIESLGAGSMGTVWKAWDDQLGRAVALKVIKEGGTEAVGRFLREARLAAAIRHPHVARVHDLGVVDGHPYLTMECVEGTRAGSTRPDREGRLNAAHGDGRDRTPVVRQEDQPHGRGIGQTGPPGNPDDGAIKTPAPPAMEIEEGIALEHEHEGTLEVLRTASNGAFPCACPRS